MEASKISLSTAERALVQDAQIILTKNSVIQKTVALLTGVQEELMHQQLPFSSPPPKISKGENYHGLPYVVLDYPRISKGEDLLFIRSMFWWGNSFSSTLQIAGSCKQLYQQKLLTGYEALYNRGYFVGINPDPWQHHFEADNYHPIHQLSKGDFGYVLQTSPHIKIAARWPLSKWDAAANNLKESWVFLTGLIA